MAKSLHSGHSGSSAAGLAIVHRLVTSDGGTARLQDTPGGGLTVVLELPTPVRPGPA
ncbi:hypothetical protein [Streptacidiphilus carbonis]|jgi:signal transduction histidine kinase|uniref:hypothetical protein n=1 Tax=Streptacidiphilus carbonis TaxID=105422 RepID=UPI001F1635B9|nr:hypothetical protein [Streptacidiphilus carbonis]